jgi:hypothetical protein
MPNVFIEPRKGTQGGSSAEEYTVVDEGSRVLAVLKTKGDAIDWARLHGHCPLIARERHLNDKKKPEHWRSADYLQDLVGRNVR